MKNGIFVSPREGGVTVCLSYENDKDLGLPIVLTRRGALKMAWSLIKGVFKP